MMILLIRHLSDTTDPHDPICWPTHFDLMLNAHLPTGSRQLAISPTADWESAFVGRCVLNADPIVGANRRYSAGAGR